MDPCAVTVLVSGLANTLASCLTDDELAVAAALLVQLGDTLATIATYRALCPKDERLQTI